jgi:hypothetical protein
MRVAVDWESIIARARCDDRSAHSVRACVCTVRAFDPLIVNQLH